MTTSAARMASPAGNDEAPAGGGRPGVFSPAIAFRGGAPVWNLLLFHPRGGRHLYLELPDKAA